MENLKNFFQESVLPVGVGVLGTGLVALLFGLARAGLNRWRPIAEKTKTQLDDVLVDTFDEATSIAEQDAIKRLNLAPTKRK